MFQETFFDRSDRHLIVLFHRITTLHWPLDLYRIREERSLDAFIIVVIILSRSILPLRVLSIDLPPIYYLITLPPCLRIGSDQMIYRSSNTKGMLVMK